MEQERKDFEEWFEGEYECKPDYGLVEGQIGWKTWQARANLPTHGGDELSPGDVWVKSSELYNAIAKLARACQEISPNLQDHMVEINDKAWEMKKLITAALANKDK